MSSFYQVYKDKLKYLKKLMKDLDHRVDEYRQRPEMVAAAKSALNASYYFMLAAKNVTGEDLLYTEAEFGLLEKAYNDTNSWFTTKTEEQERTALTEKPALVVSELQEKLISLEREVRYLVGKAKSAPRPKKKKEKAKKKSNSTETETENGEKAGEGNGENGAEATKEDEEKGKDSLFNYWRILWKSTQYSHPHFQMMMMMHSYLMITFEIHVTI